MNRPTGIGRFFSKANRSVVHRQISRKLVASWSQIFKKYPKANLCQHRRTKQALKSSAWEVFPCPSHIGKACPCEYCRHRQLRRLSCRAPCEGDAASTQSPKAERLVSILVFFLFPCLYYTTTAGAFANTPAKFFNEERAESADVACTKRNSVEKSDKRRFILWKRCAQKLFRALGFWCRQTELNR